MKDQGVKTPQCINYRGVLTTCQQIEVDIPVVNTKGGQTAILVRWSAGLLPSGLPKC